ncbi:uncharacterized protein LOC134840197 [Symsagittifera roscoffensis]|uniref:uncharacterized protein LOC134840197 n=1 Tax=Symsagittifera roscoffensis TaxID=84072 RepID=UPI00307C7277
MIGGGGGFFSPIFHNTRGVVSKVRQSIITSSVNNCLSNSLRGGTGTNCLGFSRQPHDIGHFRSHKWRPSTASAITRYNGYSIHKRIATGRRGMEILLRKISKGEKYIAPYSELRWKKHVYSPLMRFRPEGGPVDPNWKPMVKAKDYVRFHRPDPIDTASSKRTPHGYSFDYSGEGKKQKKMPPYETDKYITAVDPQYPYKPSTAR